MIRTIHRAKYVLAEPDLLLQNAALHICDPGRICRVEPWQGPPASLDVEIRDWGSAVILPGLVNAHTHLEFTRLSGQLTRPSSFTEWLSQVVEKRREWTDWDTLESARMGAKLSLAAGTTFVGDISSSGVSWKALKPEKLRKVVFEETLAFLPERADQALEALEARLDSVEPDPLLASGVSPHAPYSVSPDLFRSSTQLASWRKLPVAVHLAETTAELEFLKSGTGEFREFLSRLNVLPADWQHPGLSPVAYLESLGVLRNPAVLIHGNYLDEESVARIMSSRCSVIFCPRSHAFFGHQEHPVRRLLDLGVNVALGTDSLASNSSLSMMDEMRFLFDKRKDLKCEEIVRMATLNGALALGAGGATGRLRRGYWADMTILSLPESMGSRNLTAHILEGAGECVATIVAGTESWGRPSCSPGFSS